MTEDLQGENARLRKTIRQQLESHPEPRAAVQGRHDETTANASLEKVPANLQERARVQGLTVEGLPRSLARRLDRPQPSRMSSRSSTRALEGASASGLLPSRGWRTGRVDWSLRETRATRSRRFYRSSERPIAPLRAKLFTLSH